MKRWLVKQEPEVYSFADLERDGQTVWDGVRNFQARNNLRLMRRGDRVLVYHSVEAKEVVGIAEVTREAFPDPTAEEGDWSAVELRPVRRLARPISLAQIKADPALAEIALIRQSRLSVMPLEPDAYDRILALAKASG
jgi:predicted RNA-binding protein with PUA-like domain